MILKIWIEPWFMYKARRSTEREALNEEIDMRPL